MNKYNTVFGQLLSLVSRSSFEKLVKQHKTEYKAKGLRSWMQFAAMLFGQISGQHGLRSIETGMNSQANSFYHFGVNEKTGVKRSTLSYANNNRSADLYKSVFEETLKKTGQHRDRHGLKFKNPM